MPAGSVAVAVKTWAPFAQGPCFKYPSAVGAGRCSLEQRRSVVNANDGAVLSFSAAEDYKCSNDLIGNDDRRSGRGGVDLRAVLSEAGEREVGGIARAVGDRSTVEIDRGGCECAGVLPGADGVAESQRIGSGAAGVGRGAGVVEGDRRGAVPTVTASLRFSVSVTVLPALRSPLDRRFRN